LNPSPSVVPKGNGMVSSPPVSARPSLAAPKISPHEPVKASGGPAIAKRPTSGVRSVNRSVKS